MLPSLLYGCETWTCYRRHLKQLDQFHLRCLRKILGIQWEDRVTNQEVLRRSSLSGIEALVMTAQLRWSGHVMRLEDDRLPKQIFCSELANGKRQPGGQKKRYKDALKCNLKICNIPPSSWTELASTRTSWRAAVYNGVKDFEERRLDHLDSKRQARKDRKHNAAKTVTCSICGRACASEFGLRSHLRRH